MNKKLEDDKEENKKENFEQGCVEIVYPEAIERIVSNEQLQKIKHFLAQK